MAAIIYIEVSMQIPHAQSLKDKRHCIQGMKIKLQTQFNASVAEIGSMDAWQQAVFGIVMIASDKHYLQTQASLVENFLLTVPDVVILGTTVQWL